MDMFSNRITLTKSDGRVVDDIHSSVQKKIHIPDTTLPVEVGDTFTQLLPSGLTKTMLVTVVHVYDMGSELDHIEVDYTDA
jgi:dihydrofolate reductase